jgi:prevent-host-death family protein
MLNLTTLTRMTNIATNTWPLAEAKAKLSESIERAEKSGPQLITKHGREIATVLARRSREKDANPVPLGTFLLNSPLRTSGCPRPITYT